MPKLSKNLVSSFITHTGKLEQTRSKMEALFISGHVNFYDIEQVYAGLFVDAFTEFESVIEDLFIGLLDGSVHSKNYTTQCKVKIRPASHTRQVVFGFRPYVDWLPYNDHTIERAKHYFIDGKPFTLVNQSQKDSLYDYCVIRNALVHKSDKAYSKFVELINGLQLLPTEKTPTGYLRSKPYAGSNQTQYEIAILELIAILRMIF